MISVEMEDVLAVLQLCKPYIIGIIAALVIGIVIMIACRRMSRGKRFLIRGEAAIAMVLAVVVCVNMICFGPMSTLIGLATGNGTLSDETNEEAAEVAEEIMEDGIVLLKNESLLPLNETKKLNIFGWESINPAYGGAGSGGINDLYDIVSLNQGLENAGFSINQELVDFYNNYGADNPEMSIQKQSWTLPEPPVDTYSDELIKSAKEYSDVAVVVLSRKAGEGHNDIPMDVRKAAYDNNSDEYDDFPEGEHYLQLSQTERDMVDMVCSNFDNVIVVYNGANQFELGFADEYPQIKSVVWCPGTGNVGFNALGKVFSGEVNPSGKTPDTFIYDMTTAPWWNNAEKTEYTNLADMAVEGMNAGTAQVYAPAFTNYVEGIYVGYKYYETAAQEGAIDYDKTVQYPFGYGLSYTTFKWELERVDEAEDGTLTVRVEVTNTGNHEGKEVLQLYGSAPKGVLDKPSKILLSYAKTKLLQPGENQLVTLVGNVNDLASYDDLGVLHKSAYVMEQGEYHFYLGNSVRNTEELGFIHTEESTRVVEQLTECLAPTSLPKRMRADGSFEELPVRPSHDPDSEGLLTKKEKETIDGVAPDVRFSKGEHLWNNNERRLQFEQVAEGSVTLDEFVAQLSDEELAHLLGGQPNTGVANTFGFGNLPECGIPNFMTADGPAGLRILPECGVCTTAWPCATLLACTWNPEIVYEVGAAGAKEVRENNIAVWLTPAINIHRTPMCGRNFEYYSEDPYLVAKQAGAMVRGIQSQHIAATVKHFALNNKETNRKDSNSRVSERAARQIYLKTFERIVKEAKPWCIMSSYNIVNDYRASENHDLLEKLLRDEWGFEGVVMTDWWTFGEHCKEVNAGNDVKMAAGNPDNLLKALEKGLLKRETMECSVKRLLGVLLKID